MPESSDIAGPVPFYVGAAYSVWQMRIHRAETAAATVRRQLPRAHSSRRLRSTTLPFSRYSRGTRLLTAQVSS